MNKKLKKALLDNTSVKKNKEEVKKGVPLDHKNKHNLDMHNPKMVGASLGVTLNMGDYESARIDCWLTDSVRENEDVDSAFNRILSALESKVEEVADNYRS